MFKYSKIGKGKKQDIFLAVGSVMVSVGIVVVYLIVLVFKMAIEGDIAGAHQIINTIPGFITNIFLIIFVLMFLAIFYGIINNISKFFNPL